MKLTDLLILSEFDSSDWCLIWVCIENENEDENENENEMMNWYIIVWKYMKMYEKYWKREDGIGIAEEVHTKR